MDIRDLAVPVDDISDLRDTAIEVSDEEADAFGIEQQLLRQKAARQARLDAEKQAQIDQVRKSYAAQDLLTQGVFQSGLGGMMAVKDFGANIARAVGINPTIATGGLAAALPLQQRQALSDAGHNIADTLNRIQLEVPGEGMLGRGVRGATNSLVKAYLTGRVAGTPGIIGEAALTAANQGYTQAKDAGVPNPLAYALTSGAIEGGITAAFQRFMPGLESVIAKQAASKATKAGMAGAIKAHFKATLQEYPEEVAIAASQLLADKFYGVNKDALTAENIARTAGDVLTQTTMAGAVAGGVGVAQTAQSTAALGKQVQAAQTTRTEKQVARLAEWEAFVTPENVGVELERAIKDGRDLSAIAAKEQPSRKDFEDAGLKGMNAAARADFATHLRGLLDAQAGAATPGPVDAGVTDGAAPRVDAEAPATAETLTDEQLAAQKAAEQAAANRASNETRRRPLSDSDRIDMQPPIPGVVPLPQVAEVQRQQAAAIADQVALHSADTQESPLDESTPSKTPTTTAKLPDATPESVTATIGEMLAQGQVNLTTDEGKQYIVKSVADGKITTKMGRVFPLDNIVSGKWKAELARPKSKGTIAKTPTVTQTPQEPVSAQPEPVREAVPPQPAPVAPEAAAPVAESQQPPVSQSPGREETGVAEFATAPDGDRKRGAIVHPSAKEPGRWQITFFDNDGFSADTTRDTREEAIADLTKYGDFKPSRGLLDELAATERFAKGNEKTQLVRMINEGADHKTIVDAYERGGLEAARKAASQPKPTEQPNVDEKEPEQAPQPSGKPKLTGGKLDLSDLSDDMLRRLFNRNDNSAYGSQQKQIHNAAREELSKREKQTYTEGPEEATPLMSKWFNVRNLRQKKEEESSGMKSAAATEYNSQVLRAARTMGVPNGRGEYGLSAAKQYQKKIADAEELAEIAPEVKDRRKRAEELAKEAAAAKVEEKQAEAEYYRVAGAGYPSLPLGQRRFPVGKLGHDSVTIKSFNPQTGYYEVDSAYGHPRNIAPQPLIDNYASQEELDAAKAIETEIDNLFEQQRQETSKKRQEEAARQNAEKVKIKRERARDTARETLYWKSVASRAKEIKGKQQTIALKLTKTNDGPEVDVDVPAEVLSPTWAIAEIPVWDKLNGKWVKPKLSAEKESATFSLTHLPTGKFAVSASNPKAVKEFMVHAKDAGLDLESLKTEADVKAVGKLLRATENAWDKSSLRIHEDATRDKILASLPASKPVPFAADTTLGALDLGLGSDSQADGVEVLKNLAKEVAEFRYNPVFSVDGKKNLVFRDGFKFTFPPELFALSGDELRSGQTVGINLNELGIEYATEQEVVAEALAAQGFSNVSKPKSGTVVTASWSGQKVTVGQRNKEQWGASGGGPTAKRANTAIERIRWTQPGQPDDGPSKGKVGEVETRTNKIADIGPAPKGPSSWQEDQAKSAIPAPKSKGKRGKKGGEPTQAYGRAAEPTQQIGSKMSGKVPINTSDQSTASRQVSARDIVATLARDFGTNLKYGRVPRPAAGIYKMFSEVVRVLGKEAGSLAVETHEIAHDVDKKTEVVSQAVGGLDRSHWNRLINRAEAHRIRMGKPFVLQAWGDRLDAAGAPAAVGNAVRNGDFRAARQAVSNVIGPTTPDHLARTAELTALDYDPKRGSLQEGFAEFMRLYLTTDMVDANGKPIAPKMREWFEKEWLPAHERYKYAVEHGKELIDAYRGMTPEQRAAANRANRGTTAQALDVPAAEKGKKWLTDALDYLRFEGENILHYLEKIEREAASKGLVRGSLDNTITEVARFTDGTTGNHVKGALLGDGIRTVSKGRSRSIYKSLRDILAPIDSAEEYSEWDSFHLAQHVLEVQKIIEKKNVARTAAGQAEIDRNNGMRYEDAQAIVDRVKSDPAKFAKFEAVSKEFSGFRDALLDLRADAGEITQELANQLKAYYRRHASMRRVMPTGFMGAILGRKALNVGGSVHRRTVGGSGLPVMSQLDAVVLDLYEAYHNSMIQVLKSHILNTVVKRPDLGFNGVEGMGHWAEIVDPNTRKTDLSLDEILPQLVKNGTLDKSDADLIRAVARLRNGSQNSKDMSLLSNRYGTSDPQALLSLTKDVPDLMAVMSIYRPEYRPSDKEYIEVIHVDGKPQLVEWNPHVYETFKGMGPMALNALERALAGITDLRRLGATGLNVRFGLNQLLPDFLTGLTQAKEGTVAQSFYRPFEAVGKIGYSLGHELLTGEKTPSMRLLEETYGSLFDDFAPDAAGMLHLRRKLFLKTATARWLDVARNPQSWLRSIQNGIRNAGNVMSTLDLPTRLAEGMSLLNKHGYVERRNAQGKWDWYNTNSNTFEPPPIELSRKFLVTVADATVPFRRQGRTARYLNRVYFPYLTPSIAAAVRVAQTLDAARKGDRRAIAGVMAGMITMTATTLLARAVMAAIFPDDEEERSQYDKSTRWSFGSFSVRKPQSWEWIPNIAEALLDLWAGDKGAPAEYALEELRQQSYFELPFVDDDPVFGNVAKVSVAGPLTEAVANRNAFRNAPIESRRLQGLPPAERYDETTSTAAVLAGKVTGPVGLGPKKLEHIANEVTGGIARRNPFSNPFRPYETNASSYEFDEHYAELKAERDSAKYHKREWTDAQETEWAKADFSDNVIGALYAKMRTAPEESRKEYKSYITGISRWALGKDELESFPNPLLRTDLPDDIQESVDKFLGSKIISASEPDYEWQQGQSDAEYTEKSDDRNRERATARAVLESVGLPESRVGELLQSSVKSRGWNASGPAYRARLRRLGL